MKFSVSVSVAIAALFLLPQSSYAQGTFQWTVNFDDGVPPIAPGDEVATSYYYEQGIVFRPIGIGQFGRSGGTPINPGFPRNGTAYLVAAFTYSLSVTGFPSHFGLISVDLAEFSTLYQTPLTVQFVGYKSDGSTVTTDFITDGIIDGAGPLADFQTFYFDSRFADVVRVEVPTYGWSLDNLVFSNVVPEPGTWALLFMGGLFFWALRSRRKKRWCAR